ncbi:hypothetical protein BKK54_02100 [Rodentibacter genomosp. 1]|uniref:HTH deoR-type domain-containing protein n=1 Tax=Rodentibacter genomosp. 1 TaxID=1908264 RepID=A0A1V3J9M9_9PAST|nr:DeoR family transcriptional regulator [Rodentibacter genomosp. 1]OOF51792.1 hypothetical protein BKK54_02100 [Rodentibacter genomosp. 1]
MKKNNQLAQRLALILSKLNQGVRLDVQQLSEEFGVSLRTIQRDINRFDFLEWEEKGARYYKIGQLAGGAVAGAAAAYAVYGGVMALAAASTGTPIAALAGAVAHNAAMAAIGGGSLAAGGFGMAGGAMVLGAVVAAPIIAIAGLGFNMHAEKAKQNAVAYKEEVNQAVEKMKLSIEHLNKTSSYVTDLIVEIKRIDGQFNQYFDKLKSINTLLKDGTLDFDSLKDSILLTINNGYILAAILTDIITTPLFKVKKNSFDKMVMDGDQPVMELDENGLQILNKEEMKTAVLKGSNEEISKALKS